MARQLPIFYQSSPCLNEKACGLCRDSGPRGVGFRTTLVVLFAGLEKRDFPCRIGKPWTGPAAPLLTAAAITGRPVMSAMSEQNRKRVEALVGPAKAVCEKCPTGDLIEFRGFTVVVCRRMAGVTKCGCVPMTPGHRCPAGHWDRTEEAKRA